MKELENLFDEKGKNLEEILSITLKMREALLSENTDEFLALLEKRGELIESSKRIDEKINSIGVDIDKNMKDLNILKEGVFGKLSEIKKLDDEVNILARKLLSSIEKKIEDLNFAKNVSQKYTALYDKVNFNEGFFIDKRE
ncbi:MAG: hypothetical protein ACPLRZ_00440 [Thermovenabulum sp.]|uniref:hypothetical protein n=1 Tax=Thermovenabulum sp. TaxID=3100335 RepID=UPI003C7A74F9